VHVAFCVIDLERAIRDAFLAPDDHCRTLYCFLRTRTWLLIERNSWMVVRRVRVDDEAFSKQLFDSIVSRRWQFQVSCWLVRKSRNIL
jgi:hypothetical protein